MAPPFFFFFFWHAGLLLGAYLHLFILNVSQAIWAVLSVCICWCAVCDLIFLANLLGLLSGSAFVRSCMCSLCILNYTCLDLPKWIEGMS